MDDLERMIRALRPDVALRLAIEVAHLADQYEITVEGKVETEEDQRFVAFWRRDADQLRPIATRLTDIADELRVSAEKDTTQ